jgi:3',5'-cyclic AMP phosphodiesterase CpdA
MRAVTLQHLAAAASAIAISSCCQTVWLEVTRRHDAPTPAVALPEVDPDAIPIPQGMENRFLPGTLTAAARALADDEREHLLRVARGYTDQLDPRDRLVDALAPAMAGLDAIARLYGGDGPALPMIAAGQAAPVEDYAATIPTELCQREGQVQVCLTVRVKDVVLSAPVVAQVTYTDAAGAQRSIVSPVQSCEGVEPAEGTAPGEPLGPCASTTLGTDLILLDAVPPTATGVRVRLGGAVALSQPALTFVQLSDTQLRDNDVKLTNPVLSARLDHLVESFEHDDDQELYGSYLAEGIVATVNQEVTYYTQRHQPQMAPSFLIHTGDSIDAGTLRELDLFHSIMDRLVLPWFNVVGNHDVLVFGNFLPARDEDDKNCVSQQSITAPYLKQYAKRWLLPGKMCVPPTITGHVGPRDVFVAGDTHEKGRTTFIDAHGHAVSRRWRTVPGSSGGKQPAAECEGVIAAGAHDGRHGFDLYAGEETPGYYAFSLTADLTLDPNRPDERRVVMIGLNSEDLKPDEGGNAGRLGAVQLGWLGKVMGCVEKRDLVFLFAHHPVESIKVEKLDEKGKPIDVSLKDQPVMRSPNIVAFLYGHHHQLGLCREKGACDRFWEIEAGSLIEHPQEGRLVRLKAVGRGLAFLEVVTFTERLADPDGAFATRVRLAREGADHDHCLRNRCSDDDRVRRQDGRDSNARLFFTLPGGSE